MKAKAITILILYSLLITLAALFSFNYAVKFYRDKNRTFQNYATSLSHLQFYKARSGAEAATNKVLILKNNELKQLYPEILSEIKDLKIRVSKIQSISQTSYINQKEIITPIKDTIYRQEPAKTLNYADTWYNVTGIITPDTALLNISYTDTITQVIHRARKNPRLWIFSRRILTQTITAKNPNTKIIYNKTIQINK